MPYVGRVVGSFNDSSTIAVVLYMTLVSCHIWRRRVCENKIVSPALSNNSLELSYETEMVSFVLCEANRENYENEKFCVKEILVSSYDSYKRLK